MGIGSCASSPRFSSFRPTLHAFALPDSIEGDVLLTATHTQSTEAVTPGGDGICPSPPGSAHARVSVAAPETVFISVSPAQQAASAGSPYESADDRVARQTAAIMRGDAVAFSAFYEERFESLYRLARGISGRDEAFALDVVQDAMLRIMKSMRPIENSIQLDRWLRAVVLSVVRDRLRREMRLQRREWRWAAAHGRVAPAPAPCHDHRVGQESARSGSGIPAGPKSEAAPPHSPQVQSESAFERHEQMQWIEEQIRTLDEGTRHLMHLRFRVGWTLQRIGDCVGLSPSAVDGRIGRALRSMQASAHAPPINTAPECATAPGVEGPSFASAPGSRSEGPANIRSITPTATTTHGPVRKEPEE